MSGVTERRVGALTVRIDRLLCVGFGDCITAAPELFEFDDEGIAIFRDAHDDVARESVLEACASCPVDALAAFDASGAQIVP